MYSYIISYNGFFYAEYDKHFILTGIVVEIENVGLLISPIVDAAQQIANQMKSLPLFFQIEFSSKNL